MSPSLLPGGPRWWPEHPLEARGVRSQQVRLWLRYLVRSLPAGRGGVGQASPWEGPRGHDATTSRLVAGQKKSEDAVSCSDSSSLLGLKLVGDAVSRLCTGRGSRPPRPPRLPPEARQRPSAERGPRGGGGGGAERSAPSLGLVDGAIATQTPGPQPAPGQPTQSHDPAGLSGLATSGGASRCAAQRLPSRLRTLPLGDSCAASLGGSTLV